MTDADVKNDLYKVNLSNACDIAKILTDSGCNDVIALDVGLVSELAQFFVIGTTMNTTHLFGVYKYVEDYIKEKELPLLNKKNRELEGSWLLIDVNSIIVHLMFGFLFFIQL